jgi:hypothetical protein
VFDQRPFVRRVFFFILNCPFSSVFVITQSSDDADRKDPLFKPFLLSSFCSIENPSFEFFCCLHSCSLCSFRRWVASPKPILIIMQGHCSMQYVHRKSRTQGRVVTRTTAFTEHFDAESTEKTFVGLDNIRESSIC